MDYDQPASISTEKSTIISVIVFTVVSTTEMNVILMSYHAKLSFNHVMKIRIINGLALTLNSEGVSRKIVDIFN